MDNIFEQIIALSNQEQHTEGYHDAKKGKFAYRKVEGAITPEKLRRHLDGTAAVGVYMFTDDAKSQFMVFDFDDKEGKGIAEQPTLSVAMTLERNAIPHLIFRSGGGHGYHIWVFFDKPIHWKSIWQFAEDVLASVDEEKTKYVAVKSGRLNEHKVNAKGRTTHIQHGVEVLPKGDGLQNVALPCGRKSVPMHVVRQGSISFLEECSIDDFRIEYVPTVTREAAPRDMAGDREAAFDCFIQNFDADDRSNWGAAGLALVAAFGKDLSKDDARWACDRWIAWGSTSSKFDATADGEEHWKGLKPKMYSPLSFWRIATKHGYKGPWPGKGKVAEADIAAFNDVWALINVQGKVEFINTVTQEASNKESFLLLTEPVAAVRDKWLSHPNRRLFHNYVLEDPDSYEGDGFNMFKAPSVMETDGDAKLWQQYMEEIFCAGDQDLAHWVTTFVADAVQRPWSTPPGTALAARGPQGTGKSFLGASIEALLGREHVYEMKDTTRIMQDHNMDLFAKTVILAEESIFTGSAKLAQFLKGMITGRDMSFNPKYRASFTIKNIHRIIATTNQTQAIRLDHDDRRWTVVDVQNACPFAPDTLDARNWWAPYYDLIRNRPGDLLSYLRSYDVDRDLIGIPWHTRAKAEDKVASDPLLSLLDEIAHQGYCPHDFLGRGCISATTLSEEAKQRGSRAASRTLKNEMIARFGAVSEPNCQYLIREHIMGDGSGGYQVIERRHTRTGVQLEPLHVFRKRIAAITGETYPEGGAWRPCDEPEMATGGATDHNGGSADAFRQYVKDQEGDGHFELKDEDMPF